MPAQNTVGMAIPDAGVAAGFTNGEQAIAVFSPQANTPAGVRHVSRKINLAGGNYTVKINAPCYCAVWVGEDLLSTVRVAAFNGPAAQPVTAEFHLQQGTARFDIVLATSGGPCYFAMSIWRAGRLVYASNSNDWRFDTTFLPDAELVAVGDPRLSLPLFSFTPNWKNGVTERLSWLTDVFTSEAAVEQRRSRAQAPRRSFEAAFMRQGTAAARLNNFIAGVARGKFIVPFWPEQVKTRAPLSIGETNIGFPLNFLVGRQFEVGGLAMLYGTDPSDAEVVVIQDITTSGTDQLVLAGGLTRNWPLGARIAPAYVARFDALPSLGNVTDRVATTNITFEQDQALQNIVPSWGYCAPLWQFVINRAQAYSTSFDRAVHVLDNGTAPVEVFDYAETSRVGVKGALNLVGRDKLNAFRSFIAMARGRALRFWWPSQTHDIEPAGAIGGTTLEVVRTGYTQWLPVPQDARLMVGFYFNNGTPPVFRRVVSSESLANGNDRLQFGVTLPPMQRGQLLRISFVLPVRFDQDTFELHHVTDNAKIVQASVVVKSSEIEGLPDIECSLTSWTYPIAFDDALSVAATVTGGTMYEFAPNIDALNTTAAVVAGTLVNTLTSFVAPHDAFDTTAAVVAGTLVNTLTSFVAPHDAFDTTAAVVAGTLVDTLVSYTATVESLDITASISAGTLT